MKKRVLIADTDEQFRNELVTAIETFDEFEVAGVADGAEMLKTATEKKPDIIILDLLLPHYDGLTVLDLICVQNAECKAFVVTGFFSDYIMSALSARGVSALLKKPCPVQCVVDLLKEALRQETVPIQEKLPNIDQQITDMLRDLGIPVNIKGHRYLREAVKLAVENIDRINNMTASIYTPIASANNTTPKKVINAISRAIEIGWDRGDLDTLWEYFKRSISCRKGKPTNSECIAVLADKILLSLGRTM